MIAHQAVARLGVASLQSVNAVGVKQGVAVLLDAVVFEIAFGVQIG